MTEVTETPVSNPLYHYRASEETHTDAWSTLVKAVHHHDNWADVKQQFKDWEVEYTTVTALPVPQAWRSAKSVIKGAMLHGVPLIFPGSGEVRGKTAVEKEIKAAKDSVKDALLTPMEKVRKMSDRLVAYASQNGIDVSVSIN